MTVVRRVSEGEARRSVVQRANDNTLEYVALSLRLLGAGSAAAWLVAVVALIWTADLRWLATLVFLVIVGGVSTWLGFWTFGNEGWRRADPDR
jgi:hypothetical protein